jgi:tRNA A58 N-methylase Trm61
VHGQGLFDYLQAHPEAAATFDRGMTAYSEHEAAAILAAYDFPGTGTIVDVGGGAGALASILAAHPRARGVLFDQASVTDRARDLMTRAGVMDRCTTEVGDFFARVPDGGDLYVLKSVLHNWDDPDGLAILRSCRSAMHPRARLLIIERVVPEGNDSSCSAASSGRSPSTGLCCATAASI